MIQSINKEESLVERNTSQKQIILATIREMYHPSAEEVYDVLHKTNSTIGRATVFRNVNSLANSGQLIRISIPNAADRFECMTKNHSHFRCDGCGKIIDIDFVPSIPYPETNEGAIYGYSLLFHGLCNACQEKKKSER